MASTLAHLLPIMAVALIALLTTSPARALTLQQAQNALAGMTCSGNVCTSTSNTAGVSRGMPSRATDPTCPGEAYRHSSFGHCIPYSLSEQSSGGSCGTTTVLSRELVWNGPKVDRANEWSINERSRTTSAC